MRNRSDLQSAARVRGALAPLEPDSIARGSSETKWFARSTTPSAARLGESHGLSPLPRLQGGEDCAIRLVMLTVRDAKLRSSRSHVIATGKGGRISLRATRGKSSALRNYFLAHQETALKPLLREAPITVAYKNGYSMHAVNSNIR
jgi:hypothetical protein